jgi:uncharacterized membrane protein
LSRTRNYRVSYDLIGVITHRDNAMTSLRVLSSSSANHPTRSAPPVVSPLARELGWASAALGIPLVSQPGGFARAIGVGDGARQRLAAIIVGVRELVVAAGLLNRPHVGWSWARVAGDAMDLTLLGRALANNDGRGRARTIAATVAVAGITAVDLYAATNADANDSRQEPAMKLTAATTIARSAQDVYDFWCDFDQLPSFMAHLDDVQLTGGGRSHWRASAPFGRVVEWDAEITEDVPAVRLSWRSLDGAEVPNAGTVFFIPAPGGRGTEVHLSMTYEIPGGKLGQAVARYFGEEPHQQLGDDLRRLKQVMETGEVVRSDGAPWGKQARQEFPQHPAQPLSRDELGAFREGARA